jgi:hypothetical protein
LTSTLQLSLTVPHFPAQVLAVELRTQAQTFEAVQVCPAAQMVVPQSTLTPQLSFTLPHLPAQVVAFELLVQPHILAVPPPPHVWGDGQSLSEQHFACRIQFPAPHGLYPVEQL